MSIAALIACGAGPGVAQIAGASSEKLRVSVGSQNRGVMSEILASMDPDEKKVVTCKQCDWAGARSDCEKVDEPGRGTRWNCPECRHPVERRA